MGHQHHLLSTVTANKPCGVVCGDELALAVARWDVNTNPVFLAPLNRHQLVSKQPVVPPNLVVRVHVLAEGDQVVPRRLELRTLVQLLDHLLDFKQLCFGKVIYVLQEQLELFSVKAQITHLGLRPLQRLPRHPAESASRPPLASPASDAVCLAVLSWSGVSL